MAVTVRAPGAANRSQSQAADPEVSLASAAHNSGSDSEPQALADSDSELSGFIETEVDSMGLFRRYAVLLSTNPDQYIMIHHVTDTPTFVREGELMHTRNPLTGFGPQAANVQNSETGALTSHFVPFLNTIVLRLMNWFYQGLTKMLAALQSLVDSVILHPDFRSADLKNFSASHKS